MKLAPDTAAVGRLFVALLLIEIGLVELGLLTSDLAAPYDVLTPLFDLDSEATLPAWFSAVQLFVIGLAFAHLGRHARPAGRPSRAFFYVAAAGFAFLSMDEGIGIHERVSAISAHLHSSLLFDGSEDFMVPYAAVALLGAYAYRRSLQALWRRHRPVVYLFLAGVVLFATGAVGMEALSFALTGHEASDPSYLYLVAAEEFGEMSGASCFLVSALVLQQRLNPASWPIIASFVA